MYEPVALQRVLGQIMVREAGLEPARTYCTPEPESGESANSTTRAFSVLPAGNESEFFRRAKVSITITKGPVKRQ